MIRFQLISKNQGSLVIRKGDPIGINELTSTLKRSENNDGVIRQITIDVGFIKRARTFIKREFEQYGGPDAILLCNIYRDKNQRGWVKYATGQVNFSNYNLTEDTLTVDVEQTGFQRNVENNLDVPVDLEGEFDAFGNVLPDNDLVEIDMHGKAILRVFQKTGTETVSHLSDDGSAFFVPGTAVGLLLAPSLGQDKLYRDEIGKRFDLSAGVSDDYPPDIKLYAFSLDVGGTYRFKIDARLSISMAKHIDAQVKLVYGQTGAYTVVNVSPLYSANNVIFEEFHFDQTFDLNAGDEVYYFVSHTNSGGGGPVNGEFQLETISYPAKQYYMVIEALTKASDSIAKSSLMFEAARRCVQYATGQEDCFKSDLLGRTDLGYAADGKGSLVAITNGNRIRAIDKPINPTLNQLLQINNSLYGVGIGYETIDGKQKLVLEEKTHFYNKNLRALFLPSVYQVTRRLDPSRLFNQIKFGFNGKIDLNGFTSAIDAFNTVRQYKLPLRNSKNTLDFSTNVRADGYQVEYQRRLISSTEDGKMDDDNFIISLIRDGLNFKAKKNEGYDEILNVIDSATGYNYDFAPGRSLRNWLKYIATSLIYSENKTATFLNGEMNYRLSTRKTGEADNTVEDNPVDLFGFDPVWTPFVIEFAMKKLSCEDFEELVEKATGYVEAKDVFGATHKGFLLEVSHNPTTLAANFQLLEMFVP